MRISHKKRQEPKGPVYRLNFEISAPEVRVIDEQGQHLGVFPLSEAVKMAQDKGLDLVEINPTTTPPVAKILDFGQFKYQQEKEARKKKAHQKKIEIKGIRLSLRIGQHDLEIKQQHAKKFLEEGNKVRIEIILKGRERQYPEMAKKIMENFISALENIRIEQPIQQQAGVISMIIAKR
jgi:translation initiation factor IF-3